MENIPEKFQNEDGTLNTAAMMKSYSELEKKIGNMISVPSEDSDDVAHEKFRKAIGVPDSANDYPENFLIDDESIRNKFHEIGLTSSQVQKIYSMAEEFLSPAISEIFSVRHETESVLELEKFFGGKDKMRESLIEINSFGEKFLPRDAFESLCSTPQGIQSIHKMMQSMEPSVEIKNSEHKNFTDNELRAMMRDPKYWRERNPEYIRKIENGFKKLYA